MQADTLREVGGRRVHQANLTALFGLYNQFDALVSVSEHLREINLEHLGKYAPEGKFVAVRNMVDPEKVRRGACGDATAILDEQVAIGPGRVSDGVRDLRHTGRSHVVVGGIWRLHAAD